MTKSNKITLAVGAGAVENAWNPVIKALQNDFEFEIDGDCANSYLARIVYLTRFYTHPKATLLKEMLSNVKRVKLGICKQLKKAEQAKSIRARKDLSSILHKFVFSDDLASLMVLNTNWDTVMDKAINKLAEPYYEHIPVIHIHGEASQPDSLYLPSEMAVEAYRTEKESEDFSTMHRNVWSSMELSSKTILYGLSLDPLDAELCQTLAAGWSTPKCQEIIIIDPQHEKIAKRVKMLTDKRYKTEITGYLPWDLSNKTVYQTK
ncbi:hypothetical protein N824_07955 [Pedobacter sp. V48]|nr:hypothetical protein N824_07955 [Pedobacter sp. V48]